jgi:hypothetical protein
MRNEPKGSLVEYAVLCPLFPITHLSRYLISVSPSSFVDPRIIRQTIHYIFAEVIELVRTGNTS